MDSGELHFFKVVFAFFKERCTVRPPSFFVVCCCSSESHFRLSVAAALRSPQNKGHVRLSLHLRDKGRQWFPRPLSLKSGA